jgi:crotonobetainyl-CoA:carnitine CoA-transferase CaiB-like acyl-CoA transferase
MLFAIAGGVAIRGEAYAQRFGHRLGGVYPYTVLPCKDGYFRLCTIEESMWERVLEMMGSPEWGEDPRFQDSFSRFQHADELDALIIPWMMAHTKAEIYELCREKRVPGTPVQTVEEVVNNDHLNERGFFVEIENEYGEVQKFPGAPCKYSTLKWDLRHPAPRLGQHNEEVFCNRLGHQRERLVDYRRTNVI